MKIYLIYKNSDMTEGRGPMRLDDIMLDREKAVVTALQSPGVMGVMGRQKYVAQEQKKSFYGPKGGIVLVDGDVIAVELEVQ